MMLLLKKLNDHNYIYSNRKINVILLIDFEYHLGSPTLINQIQDQRDLFKQASYFFSVDGLVPTQDRFYFINSIKGKVDLSMNVRLLSRDIHSGEFGGLVADSMQVMNVLMD